MLGGHNSCRAPNTNDWRAIVRLMESTLLRVPVLAVLALLAGVGLLLSACAVTETARSPVPPPFRPELFSYVDVTDAHPAPADAVRASGQQRYVLSFVLAKSAGDCTPTWGGAKPLTDPVLLGEVAALHQVGGRVRVASGGALGTYLESSCPNANALADAYTSAVDVAGADEFEVDVEHRIPAEQVADALTQLRARRPVALTVTVGVLDADRGVDPRTVDLLHALAARKTAVTVNAMLMNFPYTGAWPDALTRAAETVTTQLQRQIWPGLDRPATYRRLGLTVMAGRNDTDATTTLDDARTLRAYATTHGVPWLGLWALGRDNGDCPGRTESSNTCSGIAQNPYDFTHQLAG